jgi:hypothetical protein
VAGVGAGKRSGVRVEAGDDTRHVGRSLPFVVQRVGKQRQHARRPVVVARQRAERGSQRSERHRGGNAFAGDVGHEQKPAARRQFDNVVEVTTDFPRGMQRGRPFSPVDHGRQLRQQAPLNPGGDRQLRLQNQCRPLLIGQFLP